MRYLYLFFVFANSEKFIKNINVNPCRNCIYYNPSSDIELSKCEKFGEKNIISNEIKYSYVEQCRNDELKCGKDGKYFEEDQYAHLKILQYKISNNIPIIISISIVVYSVINIFEIFLKYF